MPDRKVPGTLTWQIDHAELDLHASLDAPSSSPVIDFNKYAAIHGQSRDGQAVTVLDGFTTTRNIDFAGDGSHLGHEAVRSPRVIVGANVSSETTYESASFYVPGLQIWLAKECVSNPKIRTLKDGGRKSSYVINECPIETYDVTCIGARIVFGFEKQTSRRPWSLSVDARAYIRVESEVGKPLEWFIEQVARITSLLSLLSGAPMGAAGIQVVAKELPNTLSVLVALNTPGICRLEQPADFFLLRKELGRRFGRILHLWLDMPLQLMRASQLALSALNSGKVWPHVQFLSLTQALEGYHRGISDGKYMDPVAYRSVYQDLVSLIPKTVGSDHRASLKSRLEHGNELSLRNRLKRLSERLEPALRAHVLGTSGKIPGTWVDTRNYFTHWDESTKNNVLSGSNLLFACVRMQMFLRVLYLLHVGVRSPLLMTCLEGNSQVVAYFRWAAQSENSLGR